MGTRILKQILLCLCVVIFTVAILPEMAVWADEREYPVSYKKNPGSEEPYIILEEDAEDYMVLPGDNLWEIARKLYGEGSLYVDLVEANQDILTSPNLIYPGMTLKTARTGYIERTEAKYGGIRMGEYSMDMPYGWTMGYMESGEAWANFVIRGDGVVACLVRDREKETSKVVQDWEKCAGKIEKYAGEKYAAQVSDLHFEHYKMRNQGDGTGEVYLYSFLWHVSSDYPSLVFRVCMGMKLTDHIQAEFVGFASDYDIQGCVRYITASFEEHYDGSEDFTVNDSNMSIAPDLNWDLSGMFNPFPFLDEYFTSKLEQVTGSNTKDEGNGKYQGRT